MCPPLNHGPATAQFTVDLAVVIPPSRRKREVQLDSPGIPARELYLGRQHRAMVRAIDDLRRSRPDVAAVLYIVSSHYGLLAEHDRVLPYTEALGASPREARVTCRRLRLHEQLCLPLQKARYVLYCLSSAYLNAAEAPFEGAGSAVYIAASGWRTQAHVAIIPAGRLEARALGVSERSVRAAVLEALSATITQDGLGTFSSLGLSIL